MPGATLDASGRFSVAEVNLKKIMEAKNPEENIQIFPHDVISVPKAEMVYVTGEVKRSGGFVLGEHQSISVLQALSLAEGLNGTADTRHARILRLKRDADQREEMAVDVKDVLTGKKPDVALQGDDILFIPGSTGKKAAMRTLERLKLFALAESLGAVESLAEHPSRMTHASMPPSERERAGLGNGLIRLSVGVEDVEDLIADLESALK